MDRTCYSICIACYLLLAVRNDGHGFAERLVGVEVDHGYRTIGRAFVQIEVRAAEPVTEAKQCVAMRNLQHIVAVLEIRVVGDKTERTFDARPIFLIGFRVVEGIGFLEKITRGPQPELLDDLVVGFDAVGRSAAYQAMAMSSPS